MLVEVDIGMNRCGIDRNAIDTILVTHFHADHFGGVPFFMLDAQFNTKRVRPLTIAVSIAGNKYLICRFLKGAPPAQEIR